MEKMSEVFRAVALDGPDCSCFLPKSPCSFVFWSFSAGSSLRYGVFYAPWYGRTSGVEIHLLKITSEDSSPDSVLHVVPFCPRMLQSDQQF